MKKIVIIILIVNNIYGQVDSLKLKELEVFYKNIEPIGYGLNSKPLKGRKNYTKEYVTPYIKKRLKELLEMEYSQKYIDKYVGLNNPRIVKSIKKDALKHCKTDTTEYYRNYYDSITNAYVEKEMKQIRSWEVDNNFITDVER